MTSRAEAHLHAVLAAATADPTINTGTKRAERLRVAVATLERASTTLSRHALAQPGALLDPDVLGHPDEPDTLLGRIAAGQARSRPPFRPVSTAHMRYLMDGIADINRAAGNGPYWWQARGQRPWTKHTREPIKPADHVELRRVLTIPGKPRGEKYRLRLLAALELLWDTGVTVADLAAANTADLSADLTTITLTWNPPGRTAPERYEFELSQNTRAALGLWLPVRDATVADCLAKGHPASKALMVTLFPTVGTYDDGTPKFLPAGVRIRPEGLEDSWMHWIRRANVRYAGQPGWPMPTGLYLAARGGNG